MSWWSSVDWGAVAGAAASAWGASQAAGAARDAGNQSAAGSEQATALQREIWQQQLALMRPQYDAGNWALGMLTGSLGGPTSWGSGYTSGPMAGGGTNYNFVEEGPDGMPTPNAQLYATNPQYRQAWDATLQQHRDQWKGKGYWHGSDNEWIRSNIANRFQMPTQPTGGNTPAQQQHGFDPANRNKLIEMMQSTPGYQMGLQEGNRGIEASAAARGGLNSGATMKALSRFNQDYADARGWQPYLGTLKDIAGLTNSVPGQMANAGQNFANQAGANFQNAANARAQSTYAKGQAYQDGLGQMAYWGGRLYDNWGGQ